MKNAELFSTFEEYEEWLVVNKDKVQEYVKKNDVYFRCMLLMSASVFNILDINGKNWMSDIISLSIDEINELDMMNEIAADEILMHRTNYLRKHRKRLVDFVIKNTESQKEITSRNALYYIKSLLSDKTTKEKIIEFLKMKNVKIEDFVISVRSYNVLRRRNIEYLYEAIPYYPDGFASFRNMGVKSIGEICGILENYVLENYDQIIAYINGEEIVVDESNKADDEQKNENDPFKLTIHQLLLHPAYKEKAVKYLTERNIPIEQMGLSVRAVNAFRHSNILSFYEALSIYPDNLSLLKNIGVKTTAEIKEKMEYYILKMQDKVSAYCSGDTSVLYSDEFFYDTVMSCFEDVGFEGVEFQQVFEVFPTEIEETRVKNCIDGLLADKQLAYVDDRLYRVYPSVYTVIDESFLDFEDKDILRKRLGGATLESIAQELGLTRERIRQKFEKNFKKLRVQLQTQYGVSIFNEDYYAYVFSNYEVIKEMWLDFLGVSIETFNYLAAVHSKGQKQISEAVSDSRIDVTIKYKIQDYLKRNKILIDGRLFERQRSNIENYVLSKVARDELSYDEFADRYNRLLQQNGINFDEELYYTDEVYRSRANRISASMCCLWKQGEKLRYYDILGQDYEELLDTLNLTSFVDVEISTLKLFNDYPEIMAKYDIRDQYELHNLLKKIVDTNDYHDMVFHRQPMIQFGNFDKTQTIYELIAAFSPVTGDELAEYLFLEYGYDKATVQAIYLQPFRKYFHQGVYSVEFKRIPYDRIETLRAELLEEFYYISEIKALYKKLFENADVEEINPRSLKELGYTVFTSYVLKTYSTADAYFRDVLNSEDVFSIKEFNKRYGYLTTYTSILYDMRRNYDILLFEDGQYVNFRRIEKLGITKDDIKEYCDEVYEQIDEGKYFTIHSLRQYEINTKLETLGFDEIFLAGILAMSTKFLYTQTFGEFVFYKGQDVSGISKKSFILSQLSNYDDVEIDQFKEDCFDSFGVRIPDKYEITNAIADTTYYYDEIMDKVYRNKNVYYSEFED